MAHRLLHVRARSPQGPRHPVGHLQRGVARHVHHAASYAAATAGVALEEGVAEWVAVASTTTSAGGFLSAGAGACEEAAVSSGGAVERREQQLCQEHWTQVVHLMIG